MEYQPSNRSASIAGIWCALGMVPFEHWMNVHANKDVLVNNMLWLLFFAIFLAIPVFYLVIGRNTGPFSQTWFLDPVERAQYAVVVRRMLCWFLSAGIFGSAWSLLLSFPWNQ